MQHADWSLDTSLALGFGFLLLALVAELARRRRESSLPWGAFALASWGAGLFARFVPASAEIVCARSSCRSRIRCAARSRISARSYWGIGLPVKTA